MRLKSSPKKTLLLGCWLPSFFLILPAYAAGVYGVYGNPPELAEHAVTRVWGAASREWISSQQNREVFLTLNAFGGSGGWQQFPDAVPVLANGEKLRAEYGGICPSHKGWRQQQLNTLQQWLENFSKERKISGIWLDFIRYPGRWEEEQPFIPKTCYCNRCLTLFQQETATTLPPALITTRQKATWIDQHASEKWQQWKREQILSFVREAREIIDNYQPAALAKAERIKLGAFLVPWRKSDFDGAIVSSLAQDAEAMARHVDVFSPMVYHRMVQQPTSWVGEISRYFQNMGERERVQTWPVIQSRDVDKQEFSITLDEVKKSGAADVIVYSMKDMNEALWTALGSFSPQTSLLPPLPGEKKKLSVPLAACTPGQQYLFSAEFLRDNRENPRAYPEITLWGEEYLLNTHRTTGKYQLVKDIITCPQQSGGESRFSFTSRYQDTPISIRNPQLKPWQDNTAAPLPATNNIRCTFSVPHQPEKLQRALKEYAALLRQKEFLFYVNDEPALRSVPEWKTGDIQRIIKQYFPESPTMMAVVRPRTVPFYADSADYFMMDQYPVPSMPMSWLSDSMDEAAAYVGDQRLMSVIQAFGGGRHAAYGWSRRPDYREMYNLALLSVIHGSRGIYFFTFAEISQTEQGLRDLTAVLQRLNSLRLWFTSEEETPPVVKMVSRYRVDPTGAKAVHCAARKRAETGMLLCANTLPYPVRAKIMLKNSSRFTEYFTEERFSAETTQGNFATLYKEKLT